MGTQEHREGEKERAACIPQPVSRPAEPAAVGFDIETTGVGPDDYVTVACVWSPNRTEHCLYGQDHSLVERMLDDAKYIYTFNGVEFDLPCFAKHCGRSMEAWSRKTVGLNRTNVMNGTDCVKYIGEIYRRFSHLCVIEDFLICVCGTISSCPRKARSHPLFEAQRPGTRSYPKTKPGQQDWW